MIIGYKATKNLMGAMQTKFEPRLKPYIYDGKVNVGASGFHFCKFPQDVFCEFPLHSGGIVVLEIMAAGDIQHSETHRESACSILFVKKIISFEEMSNRSNGRMDIDNRGNGYIENTSNPPGRFTRCTYKNFKLHSYDGKPAFESYLNYLGGGQFRVEHTWYDEGKYIKNEIFI